MRDNKRFVLHALFSRWSHRGSGTRGFIICFHPSLAEKSESGAGAGVMGLPVGRSGGPTRIGEPEDPLRPGTLGLGRGANESEASSLLTAAAAQSIRPKKLEGVPGPDAT